MNEIKVKRMFLAGLAMFFMWAVVEILVEHVLARYLLGQTSQNLWYQTIDLTGWTAKNHLVNNGIAILNCTILIWLYASLRPMYGVGTKTALIASAFGVTLLASLFVNFINLGLFPARLGLTEAVFVVIEFPLAMLVGAAVYEGGEKALREAT